MNGVCCQTLDITYVYKHTHTRVVYTLFCYCEGECVGACYRHGNILQKDWHLITNISPIHVTNRIMMRVYHITLTRLLSLSFYL